MRDEQVIARAVLGELRLGLRRGSVAMSRLERAADSALRARAGYGVSPGHVRAVVSSMIRTGEVVGRVGADEVEVRKLRAGRSRVSEKQGESGQTGWGWDE